MGYQVGNHCYATKAEAENVYYSLVVPVIQTTQTTTTVSRPYPFPSTTLPSNQAKMIAPEFKNGKWYLQNNVITANLPECDPAQNMRDGAELGWYVASIMATVWLFVLLKRLLR